MKANVMLAGLCGAMAIAAFGSGTVAATDIDYDSVVGASFAIVGALCAGAAVAFANAGHNRRSRTNKKLTND